MRKNNIRSFTMSLRFSQVRFPYTPVRLQRLRAFTASPESDYNLFAKAKALRCPLLIFRGGMSKRFPPGAEQPFLRSHQNPSLWCVPQADTSRVRSNPTS
jgi:hypothetical protein